MPTTRRPGPRPALPVTPSGPHTWRITHSTQPTTQQRLSPKPQPPTTQQRPRPANVTGNGNASPTTFPQWLSHGELVSVVLNTRDRSHPRSKAAPGQTHATRVWGSAALQTIHLGHDRTHSQKNAGSTEVLAGRPESTMR